MDLHFMQSFRNLRDMAGLHRSLHQYAEAAEGYGEASELAPTDEELAACKKKQEECLKLLEEQDG